MNDEFGKKTGTKGADPNAPGQGDREVSARSLEAVVRESEMVSSILASLNTGLLLVNPDMTVAWVSGKAREMLPGRDLVGRLCYEFFELRSEPCETCAARESFRTGEPSRLERFNRATGRYYKIVSHPIKDDAGLVTMVLDSVTDVTERRLAEDAIQESEERFHELFDNMSSGVAVYEAKDDGNDFIIKDFNRAGEIISRVKKDDIIGRSVTEVFPGVKNLGLFDVFKKVWRTGEPERHPISRYEDDRITRWVENYIYKLPSGEIVAVYDDVTEQKRAEEALQKAHYELEARVGERTAELLKATELLSLEIEERKRAEEALRVAEEEKALIINSTLDLVVYYDPDLRIVWAN